MVMVIGTLALEFEFFGLEAIILYLNMSAGLSTGGLQGIVPIVNVNPRSTFTHGGTPDVTTLSEFCSIKSKVKQLADVLGVKIKLEVRYRI